MVTACILYLSAICRKMSCDINRSGIRFGSLEDGDNNRSVIITEYISTLINGILPGIVNDDDNNRTVILSGVTLTGFKCIPLLNLLNVYKSGLRNNL
jgi:hypothetical protein